MKIKKKMNKTNFVKRRNRHEKEMNILLEKVKNNNTFIKKIIMINLLKLKQKKNKKKYQDKFLKQTEEEIKKIYNKELILTFNYLLAVYIYERKGVLKELNINNPNSFILNNKDIIYKINEDWAGLTLIERFNNNYNNFFIKIKQSIVKNFFNLDNILVNEENKDKEEEEKDALDIILENIDKATTSKEKALESILISETTKVRDDVVDEIYDYIEKEEGNKVFYKYEAILDTKTCSECSSLDGKIFGKYRPITPIHTRCRCNYRIIIKE